MRGGEFDNWANEIQVTIETLGEKGDIGVPGKQRTSKLHFNKVRIANQILLEDSRRRGENFVEITRIMPEDEEPQTKVTFREHSHNGDSKGRHTLLSYKPAHLMRLGPIILEKPWDRLLQFQEDGGNGLLPLGAQEESNKSSFTPIERTVFPIELLIQK